MSLDEADADRIYRAIFGAEPSAAVRERFVVGAAPLWADATETERARCVAALRSDVDLEALELACRFSGSMPLLRKCFLLMMYIGETAPETEPLLVNARARPVLGYATLGWGTARSVAKLAKGYLLLKRLTRQGASDA